MGPCSLEPSDEVCQRHADDDDDDANHADGEVPGSDADGNEAVADDRDPEAAAVANEASSVVAAGDVGEASDSSGLQHTC